MNTLLSSYEKLSRQLINSGRFELADIHLRKAEDILGQIEQLPSQHFSTQELKAQSRIKREVASVKSFLLKKDSRQTKEVVALSTGREIFNEAVQKFNEHEYELAEQLFLESIELDETNPYAYELLGEIANLKQDLVQAREYLQKAYEMNPDDRIKDKYEKLLRETSVDKQQQQYLDEHFIIRYRRGGVFKGADIRTLLRKAYRAVSQDYGYYPTYKIPVLLYDREEYQVVMGQVPHWSGALFDGKIRLPAYSDQMSHAVFKRLVFHELTHAFALDLSRMKCPVWFQEGLAQYQENKVSPIDMTKLIEAVQTDSLITPDQLLYQDVGQYGDETKALLFYLQSFSIVQELIRKFRMYRVKEALQEMGKGSTFEDAFEQVYGQPFSVFWSDWKSILRKKYA